MFALTLAAALLLGAAAPVSETASLVWVDSCTKCEPNSLIDAYRLAASVPGHWLRFGLRSEGPIYWPQGQRIVLELKDGRRVPSLMVLGVGPVNTPESHEALFYDSHGRPIRLGMAARTLRQDELEQGHRGRGGLILAAFPDSALTSRIVSVHLERK